MKHKVIQPRLDWKAREASPEVEESDPSGDPLTDAVNDLLEAHWMFDLMGDDINTDIIYEHIRDYATRYLNYANKKMKAFLLEEHNA